MGCFIFFVSKGNYFIINKIVSATQIKTLTSYQHITLFFRHLMCIIYSEHEIATSIPRVKGVKGLQGPFKMENFIEAAVTIWNRHSPSLNKVWTSKFEDTKKSLWQVYLRKKKTNSTKKTNKKMIWTWMLMMKR